MLLYIDKKKQKRQQMKIAFLILLGLFIFVSNIAVFNIRQNTSSEQLYNYHSPKEHNYARSGFITLFAKSQHDAPKIIYISPEISREETITLAQTLFKHTLKINHISFTPEFKKQDFLYNLLLTINPSLKKSTLEKSETIITTDYKAMKPIIQNDMLYPYTQIESSRIHLPDTFTTMLNTEYPLPVPTKNNLETEKNNIQDFISDYHTEIINYIKYNQDISYIKFTARHLFLKNINICATYDDKQICELDKKLSLASKSKKILNQIPQNLPKIKFHFLTSFQEIKDIAELDIDDGILFKFENRKAILLPNSYKKENSLENLKKEAGINPLHQSSKMKFYKFKTVEIETNDQSKRI